MKDDIMFSKCNLLYTRRVDFEVRSSTSWMRFWGNQTWQGKLNQPHCAEFLTWRLDNQSTWKALYAKCPLIPENPEKKHGQCTQFPISHIYSSEVPSIVWGIESAFCFELGCNTAHSLHFGGIALSASGGVMVNQVKSAGPLSPWSVDA